MRTKVRILLTCVGGYYIYDIVAALRAAEDLDVWIVGIDVDPQASGRVLVDAFEVAPRQAEVGRERYARYLLDLCKRHQVGAAILSSEEECRTVSNHRSLFTQAGIQVSVSEPAVVGVMTDKLAMLQKLADAGIDVGPFAPVEGAGELARAARALGYPQRSVVIKPRRSSGSRGVLIADSAEAKYRPLLERRFCGTGTVEALLAEAEARNEALTDSIAMPFYGDHAYDVDCLARNGEPVLIITRRRQYQNPLSPVVEGCEIQDNPLVRDMAARACRTFGPHGAADFDIVVDATGAPRLLDASCRMSGSVGVSRAAGVNVPAQLVRLMLGLPLREYQLRAGARFRPFNHLVLVNAGAS